ncbi:MAG: acyltransferase [Porphyromonadaceae bacterium]|nr:acyltransferase [Porphyromonadaceae bacterium]
MIRIGFHKVPVCEPSARTIINLSPKGCLIFKGRAHIGNGSKIYVAEGAELVFGDNFAISASSQINCYKCIVFGRDIQFSWDCLVMDSDTHIIYNVNDEIINAPKEIFIGDKVWIGCRTTILKGTIVPDNCVIGACSLVSGTKFEPNSIIVGNPAKSKRMIKGWDL